MKEKMIMILNERGVKVEEKRFELTDGENEDLERIEKDILTYQINDCECLMGYPTSQNIYYFDGEKMTKVITREELIEDSKSNGTKLFNEFYSFRGNKMLDKGCYQILGYPIIEHISKNNKIFYEVKGGYATPWMFKKFFGGK